MIHGYSLPPLANTNQNVIHTAGIDKRWVHLSSTDQHLLKNCGQLKDFLFKAIPYVVKHPEEGASVAHFLMGIGSLTQGDMLNIFNGQTLDDISPKLRALLGGNRCSLRSDQALAELKALGKLIGPHQMQNDQKDAEVFLRPEEFHVNGFDFHLMKTEGGHSPVKKENVSTFKREFPLDTAWTDEAEQCVEIEVFADFSVDKWRDEIKGFMATFEFDRDADDFLGASQANGWKGGKSLAEFLKIIVLIDEHRGVLKMGAISEMFEDAIAAAKIGLKKPIMDKVREWERFRERYDMVEKPTVDGLDSPAKLQHGGAKRLFP